MTHNIIKFMLQNSEHLEFSQFICSNGQNSPTIVFLHGLGSDMYSNKALFLKDWCEKNNQNYLCFNYRGHGNSSGEMASLFIKDWINDAIEIIQEQVKGDVLLVGSSLGGWIMLHVALALKEKTIGIIGIAPAPDFTRLLILDHLTEEKAHILETEGYIEIGNEYADNDYYFTRSFLESAENDLLLNDVINIDCPVTLLHGMADRDVPFQISLKLAEMLSSNEVSLKIEKKADHSFSSPENLELLEISVKKMLDKVSCKQ